MKTIKIENVKIREAFEKTPPAPEKVRKATAYIVENGRIQKPIVLDEKGYLVDGYARYLAAKAMYLDEIPYITKEKPFPAMNAYTANRTAYENTEQDDTDLINHFIKQAVDNGDGLVALPFDVTQRSYSKLKASGYRVIYILNPTTDEIYTCIDWSDADDNGEGTE